MNRINQYLLTHYPLLWNTRVVWVLGANLLLHLFFFFSGLVSVLANTLQYHYSIWNVGDAGLYMMAVLCSAVVVVVWCIFYLRNNAFKSFYRIGPWYLAKEFAIIFLILLTSVSYSLSFQYGVRLRIRGITSEQEMVAEVNAVNRAAVYVPMNRAEYFALNDCEGRRLKRLENERVEQTPPPPPPPVDYTNTDSTTIISYENDDRDTLVSGVVVDTARARQLLQQPDTYSFFHYCTTFLSLRRNLVDSAETISATNRTWLRAGHRDSVRQSISRLSDVLKKYGVNERLNVDSLTNAVFANQWFAVSGRIPDEHGFNRRYETGQYDPDDLRLKELPGIFNLIEDAQPGGISYTEPWNVVSYIALSLSVLLLCYRRFSKRVFLISIVGSLLLAILTSLLAIGRSADTTIPLFLLLLCLLFWGVGWFSIRQRSNKTAGGVALCWHAYLVPFAVMLVVWLITEYLNDQQSRYYDYPKEFFQKQFPFSSWVDRHVQQIFLVNIPLVLLYIALLFNGWAKRWQAMPEE